MRKTIILIATLAAIVLPTTGCKKKDNNEGPAGPSNSSSTHATSLPEGGNKQATPIPVKSHVIKADPGPKLTAEVGKVTAEELPNESLKAQSVAVIDGHVYVKAACPSPLSFTQWSRPLLHLNLQGSRHGVVATTEGQLFVRLVGEEVPDALKIEAFVGADRWRTRLKASKKLQVTLTDIKQAPAQSIDKGQAGLDVLFFNAFAEAMDVRGRAGWGRRTPFHAFASERAKGLAGLKNHARGVPMPQRARRSDLGEMMSLYTGATSVEEALQADRGLWLRGSDAARDIDVSTLHGVPLAEHPWEDMILETKKQPVIEALASRVPHDVLYLHFHDLRTASKLSDDVDKWITPAAELVEWRSGPSHLAEQYQQQLMLERTALSKNFGHLAVNGVALVVGDPFVREGTDIAVLFDVKNRTMLTTSLGRFQAHAKAKHADLGTETYTHDGVEIQHTSTPDGAVNQHRFELDGVIVVANTRSLSERLIAVQQKKAPALSESGDFRYMRTVYPHDAKSEDGFLFISDAFVTRTVSPTLRILQARRMAAKADLQAVGYAALLHGWLEGKPASDAEALIAAGILKKTELAHQGGGVIDYDPKVGASSVAWGRPQALAPLSSLSVDTISVVEKQAYERFRDTYQTYWRRFIDPIAVRIQRTDDRLAFDARMLPLIEGSDYDELIRMVGRATVMPPKLKNSVQWTWALGSDARLRRELDGIGKFTGMSQLSFGWLGDWVIVGAKGSSALWDMMIMTDMAPSTPKSRDARKKLGDEFMFQLADRFPLYVGAHIKNPVSLVATLAAIRGFVDQVAPDMVEWSDGAVVSGTKTVNITVSLPEGWSGGSFTLHYGMAGNVFLASLDEATLAELIIETKAGESARSPKGAGDSETDAQSHIGIELGPKNGWLEKSLLSLLEGEVLHQRGAVYRDIEILARGLGTLPTRAQALGFLGYEPAMVQGGQFELKDGRIQHSLYGTETEPVLVAVPVKGAPLTDLVQSTKALDMSLEFEGEGRTRGLHVMLDWQRR